MRCATCFRAGLHLCSALLAGTALFAVQPVEASTLPPADRPVSRLTLASAPSVGLDFALDLRLALGANVALPFLFDSTWQTGRYSAHAVYQLLNENGFYMALVGGVYGDLYFPDITQKPLLALQGGAALAYDLNRDLTLRLNIVPGISLQLPPEGWIFFPPAGGLELAWRMTPHLEASLGYNGNGDILALTWIF